jgi:hypothetical protein
MNETNRTRMSERELKLVWVNGSATAGGRKRRPRPTSSEAHPQRRTRRQGVNSSAPLFPTHKQVVVCICGAVLIAIVGLLSGLWAILSYNLESRILKKTEQSELLVNEVARRLEESESLRSAILNQLRNTNLDGVGRNAAEKSESSE